MASVPQVRLAISRRRAIRSPAPLGRLPPILCLVLYVLLFSLLLAFDAAQATGGNGAAEIAIALGGGVEARYRGLGGRGSVLTILTAGGGPREAGGSAPDVVWMGGGGSPRGLGGQLEVPWGDGGGFFPASQYCDYVGEALSQGRDGDARGWRPRTACKRWKGNYVLYRGSRRWRQP